nr:hypothetical protein [Tanacetum cinerariifolium]
MDIDFKVDLEDEEEEPETISPYEVVDSPKPPPPEPDTSSDDESVIATAGTVDEYPGGYRVLGLKEDEVKRMDTFDFDLGVEERFRSRVGLRVTTLEDSVQGIEENGERSKNEKLKKEFEEDWERNVKERMEQ